MMAGRMTNITKSKSMLIVGIVVFALLYGGIEFLSFSTDYVWALKCTLWTAFYIYCTFVVVKSKGVKIRFSLVLRLVLASIVSWLVLWFCPWDALTSLGAYAAGMSGLLISVLITFWGLAILVSALLFLQIAFTLKGVPTIGMPEVIRFVCVGAIPGFIVMVEIAIVLFCVYYFAFELSTTYFSINATISQLAFGVSYYFVLSLFLKQRQHSESAVTSEASCE